MFHVKHFDVVIVGGGHAGSEAAWAAARMGAKVALVTLRKDSIGVMSCNPAIGGLGKGHLVREIDALGGLMGLAADAAGIQFRLLNRTKGPAVRGPRAQSDRVLYREFVQASLGGLENLTVIEAEATDLRVANGEVTGLHLADGTTLSTKSVVLTTGTFLRGVIHIGDVSRPGGRVGDNASVAMAERLDSFGLPMGRLKTGTPPRLNGLTIDWDRLEKQPGDEDPSLFSFMSVAPAVRQISCGITHTNTQTHDIIRENLSRSAMYGGHIDGVGPRYCPSIEDKVVRFSDKDSHQVFLEPEGLTTSTVYPNGISTSLPAEVQEQYVRSMTGLEKVEIEQMGYAIEYDYVDPRALRISLELKACPGLFLAGQINGTTGYEEAAAQGQVAAINAVMRARDQDTVVFSRKDSYIGVMIDDLTSRGVTEPYRMFTSRAEFRLLLRADNADQRLTERGRKLGLVDDQRWANFGSKIEKIKRGAATLSQITLSARDIASTGAKLNVDGPKRTALDALSLNDFGFAELRGISNAVPALEPGIEEQIKNDALYSNYIKRQEKDIAAMAKDEATIIPRDTDFGALGGLSAELVQKLTAAQPETLAQARRIDGMTPAALLVLSGYLKRYSSEKAG